MVNGTGIVPAIRELSIPTPIGLSGAQKKGGLSSTVLGAADSKTQEKLLAASSTHCGPVGISHSHKTGLLCLLIGEGTDTHTQYMCGTPGAENSSSGSTSYALS